MISVFNSRLGFQELAKGRDSGGRRATGWAATKRLVKMTLMCVYISNEPCRVLVCEFVLIVSPIIFDLEFIYYSRFSWIAGVREKHGFWDEDSWRRKGESE